MSDRDLDVRLAELADAIEPIETDLVDSVRAAVGSAPDRRRTSLVAAAAAACVLVVAITAIAPARSAVAGWLGIGNTRVDIVEELPDATPTTYAVTFDPTVPGRSLRPDERLTGPLIAVEDRDIGGITETSLRYRDVTLSSTPVESDIDVVKSVERAEAVSSAIVTDGEPALWIEGAHTRTIGEVTEVVEASTLIWVRDGSEFRITGDISKVQAIAIAESFD